MRANHMPHAVSFRQASIADADALADVLFDAVRNGESPYTEPQRAAWVPARPAGPAWLARCREQHIVVAERHARALGFISLKQGGYIDLAFVRPEARHTGIFGQLLLRITALANARGETELRTHASLMAVPAFAKHGFTERQREHVHIGGQTLERCEMQKSLSSRRS